MFKFILVIYNFSQTQAHTVNKTRLSIGGDDAKNSWDDKCDKLIRPPCEGCLIADGMRCDYEIVSPVCRESSVSCLSQYLDTDMTRHVYLDIKHS